MATTSVYIPSTDLSQVTEGGAARVAASQVAASQAQGAAPAAAGGKRPNGGGHRFARLLQPIRDLADNWQIDIALELEEYLEELEGIDITFEAGPANLNFAEAAMLIQGSACVYSKKVEYLYALVFRTLDAVASNSSSKKNSKSADGDGDDDDDAATASDDEGRDPDDPRGKKKKAKKVVVTGMTFDDDGLPEFLPLDDHLATATGISLGDDGNGHVPGGHLIPRTPLTLLSLEAAANPIKELADLSAYRLGSCRIGMSGAILLEGDDGLLGAADTLAAKSELPPAPASPQADPFADDAPDFDLDMPSPDNSPLKENNEPEPMADDDPAAAPGLKTEDAPGAAPAAEDAPVAKAEPAEYDPWTPLDPFQPAAANLVRPLQRRSTVFKPKSLGARKAPSSSLRACAFASEFALLAKREARRRAGCRAKTRPARSLVVRQGGRAMAYRPTLDDDEEDQIAEMDCDNADPFQDDAPDYDLDMDDGAPMEGAPDTLYGRDDVPRDADYGQTYEDLCRAHAEAYLRAAAQYAQETQVTQKVGAWTDRLRPLLEQQEKRPPYDIREYGDTMVSHMADVSHSQTGAAAPQMPFEEALDKSLHHGNNYEVCRMFLATLQLANEGIVDIERTGESGFAVRLLSQDRKHGIADYKAPSLVGA